MEGKVEHKWRMFFHPAEPVASEQRSTCRNVQGTDTVTTGVHTFELPGNRSSMKEHRSSQAGRQTFCKLRKMLCNIPILQKVATEEPMESTMEWRWTTQ